MVHTITLTAVLFLWSKTWLNQITFVSPSRFSLSLFFCLLCFALCFLYCIVTLLWFINTHYIWVAEFHLWPFLGVIFVFCFLLSLVLKNTLQEAECQSVCFESRWCASPMGMPFPPDWPQCWWWLWPTVLHPKANCSHHHLQPWDF